MTAEDTILVWNGGSSSLRFALYGAERLDALFSGTAERIGQAGTRLRWVEAGRPPVADRPLPGADHAAACDAVLERLGAAGALGRIVGIGHRVVHGMERAAPERVTPALLTALRALEPLDPDHLPVELDLIERLGRRFPGVPQVAAFDTAFHHDMPAVARRLAIPRRHAAAGLRRYGFHGLSYAYLMEELARRDPPTAAGGRVVLAHLGAGASMAAVEAGRSVDTSMGFTPAGGLPMATRSGDLDPGVGAFLARTEGLSAADLFAMANHDSGLLGVSETSGDMRDLLAAEATDRRAADAVELFCYAVRKGIGAYAAALGGIDALVFSGGIGEHADPVRDRICARLGFLGITVDPARNARHAPILSTDRSRVTVHLIPTDEEAMLARSVARLLLPATPNLERP